MENVHPQTISKSTTTKMETFCVYCCRSSDTWRPFASTTTRAPSLCTVMMSMEDIWRKRNNHLAQAQQLHDEVLPLRTLLAQTQCTPRRSAGAAHTPGASVMCSTIGAATTSARPNYSATEVPKPRAFFLQNFESENTGTTSTSQPRGDHTPFEGWPRVPAPTVPLSSHISS